jgi:hypothetical protein
MAKGAAKIAAPGKQHGRYFPGVIYQALFYHSSHFHYIQTLLAYFIGFTIGKFLLFPFVPLVYRPQVAYHRE